MAEKTAKKRTVKGSKTSSRKKDTTGSGEVRKCLPVLKELASYMEEHSLIEVKWTKGDVSYHLKKASMSAVPGISYTPTAAPAASMVKPVSAAVEEKKEDEDAKFTAVESPIVGTFYRATSPTSPPFVVEGDLVVVGTVMCIVEAMKLMNEIQSHVRGTIKKILIKNGEPVVAGQKLFLIDPA